MLGIADSICLNMSFPDFLDFATQLKVNVVEIKMDQPHSLSALSNLKQQISTLDIIHTYDLRYFVHAPYIDINLASVNPTIQKASQKIIQESIMYAVRIGAKLLVTHVGRLSRDYPKQLVSKSLKTVVPYLRDLTNIAKDHGLTFTIENDHQSGDRPLAGFPGQLKFLLKEIGCKLTLDVGHANTFGDPRAFVSTLAEYIANIHLHDNKGKRDAHLSLGKGHIAFPAVISDLRKFRYNEPFILEVHSLPGLRESVMSLRKALNVC